MKALSFLIALTICFSLSAQNSSNSLQASFDKALNQQNTSVNNLQANLDPSKNSIQLTWTSTPESVSSSYVIEKSSDKSEWSEVATVYGASHKKQAIDYLHIDNRPSANLSFYRIVQVEKNGEERFSNIVPVNHVALQGNMGGTNLFPLLSEDKLVVNIAFEEIFEKEILLVIRDRNGKEFYSKVIINIEDEALVAVPIETEVPSGNYLITATSENQIYSQNIVVK